jgi:hypothetical protein
MTETEGTAETARLGETLIEGTIVELIDGDKLTDGKTEGLPIEGELDGDKLTDGKTEGLPIEGELDGATDGEVTDGLMQGADDGPVLGELETVSDGVTEGVGSPGSGLLPMSFKSKLISSIKSFNN